MNTQAKEIAEKLTEAQRAAVLALSESWSIRHTLDVADMRRCPHPLFQSRGRSGFSTHEYRLTPLGLEVRKALLPSNIEGDRM